MIDRRSWRPADGLTLEPNALVAAKELRQNLALTAGPGAGKSEMLAQRADFLLRTGACGYPQRILAICFKADASRILKERVRRRSGAGLARRFDSHTFHAFAKRLIDRFRPVLQGQNALDPDYTVGPVRYQKSQITFQDMVPLAVEILTTSEVARNAVRLTYSHVFLDEFQDCTNAQYQLIRIAFEGTAIPLTAVGDTKQRIMGWAGALEGIFTRFAADFDARPLNLYQNFRSAPRLRRLQNAMVKVMDPAAAAPDAQLTGEAGEIEVLGYRNCREEAKDLADRIDTAMLVDGIPAADIAILVSKQPDLYAERVMAELAGRGIPFRNEQKLQDLSTEPAARLIIDLLTILYGTREPEAYGRLMGLLLATGAQDDDDSAHRARWYRVLDALRADALRTAPASVPLHTLKQAADAFLDELGSAALAGLSSDYEAAGRLQEVIAETFEQIGDLMRTTPDLRQALARFGEDGAIRILTIHKSKGLEFDTVAVLGVEQQTFWSDPAEERSAFFVGISRAKRRLWLTHAARRHRPSGNVKRWEELRAPHREFLGYAAIR